MSKYTPLHKYLEGLGLEHWNASFAALEELLNAKLPESAYKYPAWWSNNPEGHSHSRAWIDAGWKTEDVNLSAETITFRRVKSNKGYLGSGSPFGMLKGSVTVLFGHDLTKPIDADWNEVDA